MLNGSTYCDVSPEFLQDSANPTMIMGACVTRPALGTEGRPAFTALVGSVDSAASKYVATHRVQQYRLEGIVDLEEMAKHLVKMFQRHQELVEKKTIMGPKRIVFYRNGVSEGQPRIVLENELPALKRACEASGLEPLPRITVVIVGQRHHTRVPAPPMTRPFSVWNGNHTAEATLGGSASRRLWPVEYPTMVQDHQQNIGDIPEWSPDPLATAYTAASPIGRGIWHPSDIDFFLRAHDGLATGNPRPSHYSVVYDDNGFDPESLQELTFDLSHMINSGETGPMPTPAPLYHAKLVCAQAKEYYSPPVQEGDPLQLGSLLRNLGRLNTHAPTHLRAGPTRDGSVLNRPRGGFRRW